MADAWFFSPDLAHATEQVVLGVAETRHAGARRLRAGDQITLFDGRGARARATVIEIDRRGHELSARVDERRTVAAPAPLHLCAAIPKGDHMTVLLDMTTQLGITSFTPLTCDYSVATPGAAAPPRWQRILIEACKQSRRAHVPTIEPACAPDEAVRRARARADEVWFAHPLLEATPAGALDTPVDRGITILIGPEGGFSDVEVTALRVSNAHAVGLGSGILRVETAGVALVAIISARRATP